MVYAKNKKRVNARKLHSRTRSSIPKTESSAGKLILGVIGIATIIVVFSIIFSLLTSPEHLTKSEFNTLASKYYEDYLYENITDPSILEKYQKTGLSVVTLRQLILHEPSLGPSDNLKKYCDENQSYIKIYPEAPYKKSDYRVEFTYTCDW